MIAITDVMTYEEMQNATKTHVCGECCAGLTVAWGGAHGVSGHILRCGANILHNTMTRHVKKSEHWIQAEKEDKERHNMDSNALMTMDEGKMLTRISLARFPQELTTQDKRLLAQVAISYGLDPLMGEVTIYQGRPFVSIDGRYRKAQETGRLDGVETRPAIKQERADWETPDGDFLYRAEIYVKGSSRPFVGWGRVRKVEVVGGKGFKPVETNPQRMAEKRAEAQALRKAFNIPLPSREDIGTPDAAPETIVIDSDTGEVMGGNNVQEVTQEAAFDAMPSAGNHAPTKPTGKPGNIMDLEFANAGEFYTACWQHFKMQRSTVDKEIAMFDLSVADQRKKAWQQVVGAYQGK